MSNFKIILFLLSFIFFCSCNFSSKDKNQHIQESLKINADTSNSIDKKILVDVRTHEEWIEDGHAICTVNFPLNELTSHIDTLKQFQKVVLVCRSGNRAEQARNILKDEGIENTENGGAWTNIKCP